jgi:hypothetical protein
MKSIKFEGCNAEIGKGQENVYNVLHAKILPGVERECVVCFELTDEEVQQVLNTKKIFYHQLTFGQLFHPMRISTEE